MSKASIGPIHKRRAMTLAISIRGATRETFMHPVCKSVVRAAPTQTCARGGQRELLRGQCRHPLRDAMRCRFNRARGPPHTSVVQHRENPVEGLLPAQAWRAPDDDHKSEPSTTTAKHTRGKSHMTARSRCAPQIFPRAGPSGAHNSGLSKCTTSLRAHTEDRSQSLCKASTIVSGVRIGLPSAPYHDATAWRLLRALTLAHWRLNCERRAPLSRSGNRRCASPAVSSRMASASHA